MYVCYVIYVTTLTALTHTCTIIIVYNVNVIRRGYHDLQSSTPQWYRLSDCTSAVVYDPPILGSAGRPPIFSSISTEY